MAIRVAPSARPWSFLKTDHAAACKQWPPRPGHAQLEVIARRGPISDLWAAFRPRALVFGSAAAVPRYSFLSRCIAPLISKTFGSPAMGYFDDYGEFPPSDLEGDDDEPVDDFASSLTIIMKAEKRLKGASVTFLGARGDIPSHQADVKLSIPLPPIRPRLGPPFWGDSSR